MSGAAGTLVGTIFLTVLRAPEPLPAGAIIRVLLDKRPGMDKKVAHGYIREATRRGYLERKGKHRNYRYAVTPSCTAAPGVRIADILEVIQ